MKLILQIAVGVFLGSLLSGFLLDTWSRYQDTLTKEAIEKKQQQEEKIRLEQADRIRSLFINAQQQKKQSQQPQIEFVPDDAR